MMEITKEEAKLLADRLLHAEWSGDEPDPEKLRRAADLLEWARSEDGEAA